MSDGSSQAKLSIAESFIRYSSHYLDKSCYQKLISGGRTSKKIFKNSRTSNVQRDPSKNKGYFQSFTGLVKAPPFSESWVCADKWEHLLSLEHFSAASSSMDAFFHCHTVCVHFGAVAKDTLRNRNSFFFTPIRTIKWHCYFKLGLRSTLKNIARNFIYTLI